MEYKIGFASAGAEVQAQVRAEEEAERRADYDMLRALVNHSLVRADVRMAADTDADPVEVTSTGPPAGVVRKTIFVAGVDERGARKWANPTESVEAGGRVC